MYVFIDLETTGLDPKTDLIIEAAFAIVDDAFEIVDENYFMFPMSSTIERRLDDADEVVVSMHTGNHLLAEMTKLTAEGNNMSYNFYGRCMEAVLFDWFQKCGLRPNECELAGSGVHFDRAFLKEWMPELEEWLHYRNWDVSTLRRAVQRWAPEWYRRNPIFEAESSHRARSDVRASIEQTKIIRSLFTVSEQLWPSTEPTPL